MSLPRFSVNRSLFVNLVSVIILIIGAIVVSGINKEIFPNVAFDRVTVTTVYPGATPEDVEKLVTVPIEKEIKEVDGIKEISSTSADRMSLIHVKIDPDESDKQKVVRDIQTAVRRVSNLPREIDADPVVTEITSKRYPIIEVSLSGGMPENELRKYADALTDELEDIKGVGRVSKDGYRDREVQILLDPVKLREYYVSLDEVQAALASRNVSSPAGKIDTALTEYSIRTTGEFMTADEIGEVIIRANDSGNWLRIKDVGHVEDTFKEENVITKTMGSRSINLVVMKKESGDAVKIVAGVKKICGNFQKRTTDGLKISFINDYSFFLKRRLNVLKNNIWVALILVIGIMLVFLQRRVALMTVLGIPIAFFATFIVMGALGITINMISLFALVVVLGMLVDDGIIVAENAYRYMEEGVPPREAAVKGAEEVMGAVVTAILTTVAAFSPLLFMTGIIGKFMRDMPAVIIVALLASLGEALIILPSHLADFVKIKVDKKGKPVALAKDIPWFKKLVKGYTWLVTAAIEHKYRVVAGFAAVLVISTVLAVTVLKFVLFPDAGVNYFFVKMETPVGTPLEVTNALVAPIEDIVATLPANELDSYVTSVGRTQENRQDPFSGQASNFAQITVYLTPEQDRKRKVDQIIAELREKAKNVEGFTELRFDQPQSGPPVGKAVEARIRGEDFDVLDQISGEYMNYLKTVDGATDITWDHKPGREEIRVEVNHAMATRAGLSIGRIAKTVRDVFEGGIATTIKPVQAEEETDVTVMFDKDKVVDIDVFNDILISNKSGKLISLGKVATIKKVAGTTSIHHLDGKRVVTASCNVDSDKTTSLIVNRQLAKKFRNIPEKYIGYSVKYGGEQEETMDSLRNLLRAFFFAFLIVYLILASFFKSIIQPFVVMLAIPFGIIGVILAFLLHGLPMSFMAILGIVSLNGIVVNDSIVLVDFINKLRLTGINRHDSIIKGGQMRLRPVILTTITTVGGLSTVAYGIGGKDPFLVPMAVALCWGLMFATVLTLVIIPCIYSIMDDMAVKVVHHPLLSRYRKKPEETA